MQVFGQMLIAYLDTNKSMFDFDVMFLIVDPEDPYVERFYGFEKIPKPNRAIDAKEKKLDEAKGRPQVQQFDGSIDHPITIERKPFKFDGLTGGATSVDAQVKLVSSEKDLFTIEVSVRRKRDFSVNVKFEGDAPSWLAREGAVFDGRLEMGQVRDTSVKR